MLALKLAALPTLAAGFGFSTDSGSCTLPVPSNAEGGFAWVQTGAVAQLWTTSSHPRNLVVSTDVEDGNVANGAFYTPFCLEDGYTMDIGCVVQCVDGEVDYDTYCAVDAGSVCVPYEDSNMVQNCQLDWDTDEEFQDTGKSLKAIWAEVLQKWYYNLEDLFTQPAMSTELGADVMPDGVDHNFDRVMILPHGLANLINMGLGMNIGINSWDYRGYKNMTLEDFNLAVYVPTSEAYADFTFVEDPIGTTSDGPVFFPNDFGAECMDGGNLFGDLEYETTNGADDDTTVSVASGACIYQTSEYPEEMELKPTAISIIAMEYNPCDQEGDPVFMGLPKACFHIHQAGAHMENGNMWPFYKPLKDGTLDFFGVCAADELTAYEYLSDAYLMDYEDAEGYGEGSGEMATATEAAGGLALPHGRTWGLHFCLDFDDIEHPYPCTLGTTPSQWNGNGDLGDFMILDPLSFVYNPVTYADDMCQRHLAGECDWSNLVNLPVSLYGAEAGDGSIVQQDYAVDYPTPWVSYD